ncbi:MAG TPA: hypothetical protein PLA43_00645 [Bryobacteraceae bacterium]|nr:hypothetical protein [Bryobacteraceae bacterium]HOL72787.1 hypothetical protein [Bryobacteraceae bacterium]HOQ44116.1 hypothetical protein [Bryobacteraceae bacterium]HPQ17545.1 hypothetical protein [Bryobacteraceae bacterium]HPU70434.1 hypothetical protein [Bryobacteraceae bacterium]
MGQHTRRLFLVPASLALAVFLPASESSEYLSAQRKIDLIRREAVPAGSAVILKKSELNAYVEREVRLVAPQGVRNPRLELGNNFATAFAHVDFAKLQRSQGQTPSWLVETLLSGERPVRVDARIRSGSGRAVVDVEQVVISGITISGSTLDYLIRNFLWAYYPDAKVGKPFELAHRIDRLEVSFSEVRVVIAR